MVVNIYHPLVRLFPPTWQHHHLMIVSTIVSIIQWQLSMIAREQYGKANLRRDASLLRCTLRSRARFSFQLRQQLLRFLLRQPSPYHLLGQAHVFGHIPSSLRLFEHRRLRRKEHLKSLPSRGLFCYCYLSVDLAQWRHQSSTALCVQHP